MSKKTISVVIPVYNEQENVLAAHAAVTAVFKGLEGEYDHEILFADNHSEDNTFVLLRRLAQEDPRVRAVRWSRNCGYQKSIFAACRLARGDAAIILDCDLQDPPEMIVEFLARWKEGSEVVYGVRVRRQEGWLTPALRKLFYRLVNRLSDDEIPLDAGDFRLVDRKVLDVLREVYDFNPYLRGLIATLGFRQTGIPYERRARAAGKTKFPLSDVFKLGLDGIVNQSVRPLKLATLLGFLLFLATVLFSLYYVGVKLFFRPTWPEGLALTVTLILLSISINALLLGIMGEYIARIFQQTKGIPIALIEESANLEEKR